MLKLWHYLLQKVKHIPKRKRLILLIAAIIVVIGLAVLIWAIVTGRIRPFGAIVGQVTNTATVTYTDSSGATQTVNSNTVVTDIVAPPNAPTNLTATAASSSQINLAWRDNSSNETGFKIERATPNCASSFSLITTTAANVTTYQSTGLNAGTTYCYHVKATDADGDSAFAEASATTQGGTGTTITLTLSLQGKASGSYAATGITLNVLSQGQVCDIMSPTCVPLAQSRTVSVDNNGNGTVSLNGIANGTYDFDIKVPYYLSTRKNTIAVTSNAATVSFGQQTAGDLNNNNQANNAAYQILNLAWSTTQGDTRYNPIADIYRIDALNQVNAADYQIFNTNYGKQGN